MTRRIRDTIATTTAVVLAVAAAGCGGNAHRAAPRPTMPAPLADQLARKSDDVADKLAAGDACSALDSARELHAQAVAAVGAHQVPRPLQDLLLTSTEELANRIACVPVVKKPPKKNDDAHEHKHEHEHGRDEKGKKH